MTRWYQLSGNDNNTQAGTASLVRRMAGIERRLADLEWAVQLLQAQPLADRARYSWGDRVSDTYYHRGDVAGTIESLAPWIGTTARIIADLTSERQIKVIFGQAAAIGLSFGILGGGIAYFLDGIHWYQLGPAACVTFFALGLTGGVLHNRGLLHRIVTQQGQKKRQTEMRIQIDKYKDDGPNPIDFLYLNAAIEEEQLQEFARAALRGASLALHNWTGKGALFSRGQYDSLMAELERMGYVRAAAGNIPRTLTKKGLALMRGLSDD